MGENSTRKGLAAIYRQEIIQDVTLFTSQSAATFYDKLFTELDFTLPRAATGRRGFPKEAILGDKGYDVKAVYDLVWEQAFLGTRYYVDTVGRNKNAIQEYIRNQLKEDELADQMRIKEYYDPFTGEEYPKRRGNGTSPFTGGKKP